MFYDETAYLTKGQYMSLATLTFEQEVLQALAKGYCHKVNATKVADPELLQACYEEVMKVFRDELDALYSIK